MSTTLVASPRLHVRLKLLVGLPLVLAMLAALGHFFSRSTSAPISFAAPPPVLAAAADASSDAAAEAGSVVDAGPASDASALEVLADGAVLVDLNHASEAELRRLPGIGPTRARAILALRVRLGRFRSVDDLSRIQGFGRALLRKLRVFARAL